MTPTSARNQEKRCDSIARSGTSGKNLEWQESHMVLKGKQDAEKDKLRAVALPPRVPNQTPSEREAAQLPALTPKRDVLTNSVISRPQMSSEKYWANFSYVSAERKELERVIGYE